MKVSMIKFALPISLLLSTTALAAPLVFDEPGTRGFDYTAIGGNQLKVCTINCLFDITGNAYWVPGADIGTFDFGPLGPIIIGPEVAGVFAFPASQTFSFVATDGDQLSGVINWSTINDDTLTPTAHGILNVTSTSGDPIWLATWGNPAFNEGVFFSMSTSCSLHHLALQDEACPTNVQESVFISGEIEDQELPEPNVLKLSLSFLTMMGISFFFRKRKYQ